MALTRIELDQAKCSSRGCDHSGHSDGLYMRSRCHISSPTWCCYKGGVMVITCAECDSLIAEIKVAES